MTTELSLIQASLAEIMPEYFGLPVNKYETMKLQLNFERKQKAEA